LIDIGETYERRPLRVLKVTSVIIRDGKEREPSNNEPNKNPGLAKNRTEPAKPKCRGICSVLPLNEFVGTFTHFTVNEELGYLG